jgi:hypothetical protein
MIPLQHEHLSSLRPLWTGAAWITLLLWPYIQGTAGPRQTRSAELKSSAAKRPLQRSRALAALRDAQCGATAVGPLDGHEQFQAGACRWWPPQWHSADIRMQGWPQRSRLAPHGAVGKAQSCGFATGGRVRLPAPAGSRPWMALASSRAGARAAGARQAPGGTASPAFAGQGCCTAATLGGVRPARPRPAAWRDAPSVP